MLRIEKLSVGRLPPLTFEVRPGECFAVEGPSGSGKTLLLRAIADLDPAEGYVFLEGVERREMQAPQWRRRVRYCSAEPGWWAPTAAAHVPRSGGQAQRLARHAAALGLEPSLLTAPIAELSTGERLRMALARGLADEPTVLVLDEPTASLDRTAAAMVEELIRFQVLAGRMVVLAAHDTAMIGRLSNSRLQLGPSEIPSAAAPAIGRTAGGAAA